MDQDKKIRVLVAKPDWTDMTRGQSDRLRAAGRGFRVVYTGLRQTPEMIANAPSRRTWTSSAEHPLRRPPEPDERVPRTSIQGSGR